MRRVGAALVLAVIGLAGCAAQEKVVSDEPVEVALGPVDGHDLAAQDLERVQVGQTPPDFTLTSLAGANVTLSSFQGQKNVVLVFYRGHW